MVTSLCPVDFSNAGPSSSYTLKNPAEIITLMSAAVAARAASVAAKRTITQRKDRRIVEPRVGKGLRVCGDFTTHACRRNGTHIRLRRCQQSGPLS